MNAHARSLQPGLADSIADAGLAGAGASPNARQPEVDPTGARAWRIGVFAPSGQVLDPAVLDRAVQRLEDAGHSVHVDRTARSAWQRFSASDDERIAAFERMAAAPGVELAIAARGGYGISRLLDRIDFVSLARARKRWMGHSDFTAFSLAALARAGMTSFAGPMASYDFGAPDESAYTASHCWALLASERYELGFDTPGTARLGAEGMLWGGNLAMVAHLVGTPYLPAIDGGILFLEDIGEHPYRIERMLYQLHFAGVLARQKAVLLGSFTGYTLGENDAGYDLPAMLANVRERTGVPFIEGLPFGHCPDKVTLPVGGTCSLEMSGGRVRLLLSNYQP